MPLRNSISMHLHPQILLQIQSFLELPDEATQPFLGALENAESKFNVYDLTNNVVRGTRLPPSIVG
jgi:hypothetical protein